MKLYVIRIQTPNHTPSKTLFIKLTFHRPRNASKRSELICCGLAPRSRQCRQQCALSDTWKSHKSHPRISRFGNIETPPGIFTPRAFASRTIDEFRSQFGKFGLERAKMIVGGLVLLGPGHLEFYLFNLLLDGFGHGDFYYWRCCGIWR